MYHPGKFRGRAPPRDSHSLHSVHLTLQATATPVNERPPLRYTPDRQTREATFKPSDLPLGQSLLIRRTSAHSDIGSSSNSLLSAPTQHNVGVPLPLHHVISDTRLITSPYKSHRQQMSPSKAFATEISQLSSGDRQSVTNSSKENDFGSVSSATSSLKTKHIQKDSLNKLTQYMPGDRVIFAESPSAPGIPIVYRSSEERATNPDRLNLDRRKLTVCPILEGEEHLRLLNFQHNFIIRIQHLSNLRRLIFLDLYDNQVENMNGLAALKSLRVLMLGKNRISSVSGLENLVKLDVLDLHGNQISQISNLRHLTELRVLNLAGNRISRVDSLAGMDTLTELNLRRNQISVVHEVDLLPSLQRLFLSYNNIASWKDVSCMGDTLSITEISLDGNPIANESWYKQVIIKNIIQLKQLDMKRISEDERRVAAVMVRKEEERKREVHKQAIAKEKKRLAINNAARMWESKFGAFKRNNDNRDQHSNDGSTDTTAWENKAQDIYRNFSNATYQQMNKQTASNTTVISPATSLDISETFLAEIDGANLQLFGPGALESLDKNWGVQTSASVTTITVQFINFDEFCTYIPKIRNRFPNAANLVLKEVNLHSLAQINALALLRRLDRIWIECSPGNPVTQFSLWRPYLLFRLAHFTLRKINGQDIATEEAANAEKLFGPLTQVTTFDLSPTRLLSLVGDSRDVNPQNNKNKQAKVGENEDKALLSDRSATESVSQAGLQYIPTKHTNTQSKASHDRDCVASSLIMDVVNDSVSVEGKQAKLLQLWPSLFIEMIKNTVADMLDKNYICERAIALENRSCLN